MLKSQDIKDNFTASAAPLVTDDSNAGYQIGSRWIYNNIAYICVDVTVGAANWNNITSIAGEGYLGAWASSTNTPTLADGTGTNGHYYIASDAGSVDFGAGSIVFTAGDQVVYNGTIWQKIEGGVSYTPEDQANKATDFTTLNDTLYPSVQASETQIDSKITALSLGTISTQNANAVAITGGTIDGASVGATTPLTALNADEAIIGDPGTEGSGINIGGTTYESSFKVSDIDGTNYAQTILHRHSTTLEPLVVGARANSNTSAHADVVAGQNVFSIYGAGYAGSNYKLFGSINVSVDTTGTISNTSSPGKITFNVTPDGSVVPEAVLTLGEDKGATFVGDVVANRITGILGSALTPCSTSFLGNLIISANSIFSNNTNGDIVLDPNGTGKVDVQSDLESTGEITSVSALIGNVEISSAFIASASGSAQNMQIASDTGTIDMLDDVEMGVGKTFEGRDIATDGIKLDTIETSADVTDATNVAAAGAPLLSTVNTFTKAQSITPVTLTSSGAAVAIDASLSNIFVHTLTENTTFSAPSNLVNGTTYSFVIKQHASSAKTLAFNSVFLTIDGVDPVMPTTLSAVMMVSCLYTTLGGLLCVDAKNFE